MARLLLPLAIFSAAVGLAGCRCGPCRPVCRPCDPCGPVASAPTGSPGVVVSVAPEPRIVSGVLVEGQGRVVVIGPDGKEAATVGRVIGPDGKPIELKVEIRKGATEGARIVEHEGKVVLVITDEEDDEDEEGKPGAPAAAATDRGFLGFSPVPAALLTPEARTELGIQAQRGLVVAQVFPGSPAEKAGLKVGDVVVRLAGQAAPSDRAVDPSKPETILEYQQAFARLAGTVKPGARVEIQVEREGKPVTLTATAVSLAEMRKIAPGFGQDDEDDEGEDDERAERK